MSIIQPVTTMDGWSLIPPGPLGARVKHPPQNHSPTLGTCECHNLCPKSGWASFEGHPGWVDFGNDGLLGMGSGLRESSGHRGVDSCSWKLSCPLWTGQRRRGLGGGREAAVSAIPGSKGIKTYCPLDQQFLSEKLKKQS